MKQSTLNTKRSFWDIPIMNKDYKQKFIVSVTISDLLSYMEKRAKKKKSN